MNPLSILAMIFILSFNWGGLLYFLNIAKKREREFKEMQMPDEAQR